MTFERGMSGIEQRIIFEDNHLLIFNKNAGELVQGDKTGDTPLLDLLKAWIKQRDEKPGNVYLGAPHRLDRPVSGIVVFAKTSKSMSRLSEMFRQKEIDKTYWAISENKPSPLQARLLNWLIKNEKQNKSYVSDQEKPNHKASILSYKFLISSDKYHLIEVMLETGRHHQIRAQMAHIACCLLGDLKYGAKRPLKDGSIGLHARKLVMTHPVKKVAMEFCAPCPPGALWQFFEKSLAK